MFEAEFIPAYKTKNLKVKVTYALLSIVSIVISRCPYPRIHLKLHLLHNKAKEIFVMMLIFGLTSFRWLEIVVIDVIMYEETVIQTLNLKPYK